ncbi:MAG: hypothetical protein KJ698_02285 [Actinobacteria bacterium]|nr:hypothetical protein [Actinomycetota bacterium]MBU1493163.1 hypothetical protein [Actinomycetota bacterium]MBU1865684.1 hypothetical protein [Actinomycetota bacterium]
MTALPTLGVAAGFGRAALPSSAHHDQVAEVSSDIRSVIAIIREFMELEARYR